MDKIIKALKRFIPKEQKKIKEILLKLKSKNLNRLDIKKLKSRDDIFRARLGSIRIIYRIDKRGNLFALNIERRSNNTYRFFV